MILQQINNLDCWANQRYYFYIARDIRVVLSEINATKIIEEIK